MQHITPILRKNTELVNYGVKKSDMKQFRFALLFLVSMLYIEIGTTVAQEHKNDKELIQQAVGESRNWTNTRYLLFAATGSSVSSPFPNERSFLIDKSTGDCRFEGTNKNNENVVLLFNYKSGKSKKCYVNGKESTAGIDEMVESIIIQFFADTQLLFLPAFLTENLSAITDISQKILNSDKIAIFSFSNVPNFGEKNITGKILITSKGEIKSISLDNSTYTTSASKDIGSGILLPTLFEGPTVSIKFNTVAAFTQIESGKFTTL